MPSLLTSVGLLIVASFAAIFQLHLKEPIWLAFGIGKEIQPLSDFPYTCRKIVHPEMQACEDMWLSESTRQLFLACSDPVGRSHWTPNVAKFNVAARSVKDAIVALQIDKPVGDGFELRTLKTPEYTGAAGDGLLSVSGFGGIDDPATGLTSLYVLNTKPSVDPETGTMLDQYAVGANTTVELFTTGAEASELDHVRTYHDPHIATPNRVAPMSDGSFYITNDRGLHKLGLQHYLSPLLGTADVTLCGADTSCVPVVEGLKFPNGLARGIDDLIYVPSSTHGDIKVYERLPNKTLHQVDEILTGYALDNISVDRRGDLYVSIFPRGIDVLKAFGDPWGSKAASAAIRVTKEEDGYRMEKIIEDGFGEVLPASTTVVHDAETGRLFFSSVISPWIAVCDPQG